MFRKMAVLSYLQIVHSQHLQDFVAGVFEKETLTTPTQLISPIIKVEILP